MIPFIFFALTCMLASIGPGHIAACALMAPLAMAAAGRYGISPFLMAIMVANGASAGSLSPIAPTGVVVEGITTKMGLGDVRWTIYLNNFIAHTAIAFVGYLLLGGWKLFRGGSRRPVNTRLRDSRRARLFTRATDGRRRWRSTRRDGRPGTDASNGGTG